MLSYSVNHLVGEILGSAGFNLCNVLEGSTIVPGAVAEEIELGIWSQTVLLDLIWPQTNFYQILLPSKMEDKSLLKGWTLLQSSLDVQKFRLQRIWVLWDSAPSLCALEGQGWHSVLVGLCLLCHPKAKVWNFCGSVGNLFAVTGKHCCRCFAQWLLPCVIQWCTSCAFA